MKRLRSLFERGFSYDAIGRDLGISKATVCGKLSRLGVQRPRSNNRSLFLDTGPRSNADTGCPYIAGDPIASRKEGKNPFCGAKRRPGSPYCDEHHVKCYQPPTERSLRLERLTEIRP